MRPSDQTAYAPPQREIALKKYCFKLLDCGGERGEKWGERLVQS
jgi:hypothetical protein